MSASARFDGHLTRRELEVLTGLADDLSYAEIAERLVISPHTVHNHVRHIYAILIVNGRAGAVAAGLRRGMIA